ncbi:uncharacterized protein LOC115702617 [Cannabis sativa]|uniref:uncharacterized protein LOC115702617 n=1 Tax=Cannabis sativa TaxID=3483 RepID=UPI0029CA1F70|nr:uncharacterized protein LOC115702617 [Cannabis sativa]
MAMSTQRINKPFFSSLRLLLQQRFCHAVSHRGVLPEIASTPQVGLMGTKKSNKVDSRAFGIHHNAIPPAALTVLRILRNEGFDAYLVGGCVRDLILKRTPKDFDVITTANLKQIRSRFHKAHIVGQRFPICMVHVRGSIIEVSSFETVAKHAEKKTEPHSSQAPRGFGKKDLTLWRNSLKRDYTINSLFFDPFSKMIYDYANGMADLRSLKLRTLIPADVSFKEDCARILRGLRLAARLGFSFSSDTATAIRSFSSSLLTLSKSRIMMEFNYMLSYGAAEPSLCLLQRFNLLRFFLPFHAAYLEQQASTKSDQNSTMLMKLFFNMDKVVSCDHPSDCRLWVGLLAFHLTLINNPQDALVVLTFASILYHGEWKEGIRFAKENSEVQAKFVPELSSSFAPKFDEELVMKVSQLAILVQDSLDILTESENYLESVTRHPTSPCSGLVFIPKRTSKDVAEIFQLLVKKKGCQSHEQRRKCFDIDYALLGQGYLWETRFVVGKVILETMGCWQRRGDNVSEENNCMHTEITGDTRLSDVIKEQLQVKKGQKHSISLCSPEIEHQPAKKRNFVPSEVSINSEHFSTRLTEEVVEIGICQERANKHTKFYEVDELPREELISVLGNMSDNRCEQPNENATEKNKSEANKKKKKKKKQTHKSEKHSTVMEKKHHVTQEDEAAEQQGAVQENISDERCQKPDEKANEKKKGELKTKKHTHKSERPSTVKEKKLHVTQEDEAAEQQGAMQGNISDERCQKPDEKAIEKKKGELKTKKHTHKSERPSTQEDKVAKQQGVVKTKETEHKQVNKETGNRRLLSDIFK